MAENPPQKDPVYDDGHEFPLVSEQPAASPTIQQLRKSEGINNPSSTTNGLRHGGSTSSTSAGGGGSSSSTSPTGEDGSSTDTGSGDVGGTTTSTQGDTPASTSDLANQEAGSGLYNPNASSTGGISPRNVKSFFWGSARRRRRTIIGGAGGFLVGGGLLGLTFISGPLQFVHFAQLLQKWHMSSNENFGDNRASKVLLNALGGNGRENTRLGTLANKAANVWENRLLSSTGLKPVYSGKTRRFVGFAIMDENKTFNSLLNASDRNDKTSANIERVMGKGAEITTAGAAAGPQGIFFGGIEGEVPKDVRLLSVANVSSFNERAKFIRSIGTLTNSSKLASSIGSRLLIKRAGVDFHPLKNVLRKSTDKIADYNAKRRAATAQEESTGTTGNTLSHNTATDKNGKPVETPAQSTATESANSAITKAEASVGTDIVEQEAAKIGTGGALVGIVCAAKTIGDNVPKFKYINDILPMIRMGWTAMTLGNQVMSGQGANLNELGAESQAFNNPKDGTSWINARSVQAEMGQPPTGPDLPPEAQIKNVGSKPKFFSVLDSTPALGAVCSLSSLVSGIPIIGDIVNAGSSVVVSGVNAVAGIFGTSLQKITTSLLAAAAGKTVNTLAQGAEYGGLANTGAFLAADQNAITMGGVPLQPAQVVALNAQNNIVDSATKQSFSQRYLDPYNNNSLVGSLINHVPPNSNIISSATNSVASFFSGGLGKVFGNFIPKAHADTATPYDYGVPQYGFSLADQNNPTFDDPYANAAVIEQPGVLDTLNQKYGQTCFGMTVTDTPTGVSVQTEAMGSDNTNMVAVQQNHSSTCDPTINQDPMFLRYRFYLADAVTTESLACYEADDVQSCTDLGNSPSGGSTTGSQQGGSTAPGKLPTGSATDLAKQLLPYISNGKISCNFSEASNCPDIQNTANGVSLKNSAPCAADALSPALLGTLLNLVQAGHTFILSALCSGHSFTGTAAPGHSTGQAADFNWIDGVFIGQGEDGNGTIPWTQQGSIGQQKIQVDQKLVQDAASFLPTSSGFGQTQCHPTYPFLSGFVTFPDGCHHQHIQVAN